MAYKHGALCINWRRAKFALYMAQNTVCPAYSRSLKYAMHNGERDRDLIAKFY